MAETPESQATTSADNTHWGIAYLREDLKSLRQQIVETNKRIDQTNKRIDEINQSLIYKSIKARFIWSITTMVVSTGVLIAVIKL